MKKWIVWFFVILVLGVASVYIFIPAKIVITTISSAEATITGEYRYISQEENWEKWWLDADGKSHKKGEPFTFGTNEFRINRRSYNAVGIDIRQGGTDIPSFLNLISFAIDSTGAVWSCEMPSSFNPVHPLKELPECPGNKKEHVRGHEGFFVIYLETEECIWHDHLQNDSS